MSPVDLRQIGPSLPVIDPVHPASILTGGISASPDFNHHLNRASTGPSSAASTTSRNAAGSDSAKKEDAASVESAKEGPQQGIEATAEDGSDHAESEVGARPDANDPQAIDEGASDEETIDEETTADQEDLSEEAPPVGAAVAPQEASSEDSAKQQAAGAEVSAETPSADHSAGQQTTDEHAEQPNPRSGKDSESTKPAQGPVSGDPTKNTKVVEPSEQIKDASPDELVADKSDSDVAESAAPGKVNAKADSTGTPADSGDAVVATEPTGDEETGPRLSKGNPVSGADSDSLGATQSAQKAGEAIAAERNVSESGPAREKKAKAGQEKSSGDPARATTPGVVQREQGSPAPEKLEGIVALGGATEHAEGGRDGATPAEASNSSTNVAPSTGARTDLLERISQSAGGPTNPSTDSADHSKVDRVQFVQRVARAFEVASQRDGAIRLRLSPPELGSVRVEITIRDGVMRAQLEAETPAARQTLLENVAALREKLAEQDIRLERFDVDLKDQSRDSMAQQQRDHAFGEPGRSGRDGRPMHKNQAFTEPVEPTETPSVPSDDSSGLNVIV
jgi:flagellar hook-length control protein FliK